MKTLKQVQEETEYGDAITIQEFIDGIFSGCFHPYNGEGSFHDGEKDTDKSVWSNISLLDIRKYPYVLWFNK